MRSNPRDIPTSHPGEGDTPPGHNGDAGPARIESSFEVDGHHVRLSIRRLDEYERERVAAEIAWFADVLSTPGVDADAIGWMPFIQRLLDDVDMTVDDDVVDRLQSLWDRMVWRTLHAYIDANGLDPSLKRCLHSRVVARRL